MNEEDKRILDSKLVDFVKNGGTTSKGEQVMSYEQFKKLRRDPKYVLFPRKCFACGIKPALWELGDARYYAPGCEKCARVKESYECYLKTIRI